MQAQSAEGRLKGKLHNKVAFLELRKKRSRDHATHARFYNHIRFQLLLEVLELCFCALFNGVTFQLTPIEGQLPS